MLEIINTPNLMEHIKMIIRSVQSVHAAKVCLYILLLLLLLLLGKGRLVEYNEVSG